ACARPSPVPEGTGAAPRAVVVGDLMVIVSGGVAAMPRPGDNVVLQDAGVFVTGVGANVAIALRALGVEVALASAVGDDPLGVWILDDLQGVGVDVSLVRRAAGSVTGATVRMVAVGG